jgi:hypothetical protein
VAATPRGANHFPCALEKLRGRVASQNRTGDRSRIPADLKPDRVSNDSFDFPHGPAPLGGEEIFARQGCAPCHTPPLYTINKLIPADRFTPPPHADEKYDILPIPVGTDPNLALNTRRGTGYYKVPSLRGVRYRGVFGHSGWCARSRTGLTRAVYRKTTFPQDSSLMARKRMR